MVQKKLAADERLKLLQMVSWPATVLRMFDPKCSSFPFLRRCIVALLVIFLRAYVGCVGALAGSYFHFFSSPETQIVINVLDWCSVEVRAPEVYVRRFDKGWPWRVLIASVARSCGNPRRHAKTSEDERPSEDERRRAKTRDDERRDAGVARWRSASLDGSSLCKDAC